MSPRLLALPLLAAIVLAAAPPGPAQSAPATEVANAGSRPMLNGLRPDPTAPCRQ